MRHFAEITGAIRRPREKVRKLELYDRETENLLGTLLWEYLIEVVNAVENVGGGLFAVIGGMFATEGLDGNPARSVRSILLGAMPNGPSMVNELRLMREGDRLWLAECRYDDGENPDLVYFKKISPTRAIHLGATRTMVRGELVRAVNSQLGAHQSHVICCAMTKAVLAAQKGAVAHRLTA
jgi:hypothetical protein